MTSSSRKGKQLTVAPKKPHFLSIIMKDDAVKRKKLWIPRRFVRDYGKGLANSVLLKVPGGEPFKVRLSKAFNEVFLQDGWKDFVDYYSIDYGHSLLFKYKGDSRFTVIIIDITATEIDYPCNNRVGISKQPEEHSENDDIVVRVSSDSDSDSAKRTEGSQPSTSAIIRGLRRKAKFSSSSKDVRGNTADKTRIQTSGVLARNQPVALGESVVPSFAVKMKRTKLPPRSTVGIPAWFAKMYLTEDKDDVTLHVLNKGIWKAKCRVCQTSLGPRVRFINGWGKFATANHLAVGDTCVFRMIQNDKSVVFQVSISRHSE